MVLVDTSIWSLALRRRSHDLSSEEQSLTRALRELIQDGRAQIVGLIRQELLSGIREQAHFLKLRDYLRAFDEPHLEAEDYEEAAQIHNRCRARGISGSTIDFLICAAARRRNWEIFTTDKDFQRYANTVPLRLFHGT